MCNVTSGRLFQLKKKGFVSTDGLEPSEGMLAEAKRNNLYGRYICDVVGENTFDIETGG